MKKVLIIEDELPTQRLLVELINQLRPDWEVLACIESVSDAIEWLDEHSDPDLIFSDIQLADGLCFEIYETVRPKSYIIFTTAYDEYAIRAFSVNSVDYLLKPVDLDALETAIQKYESLVQLTGKTDQSASIEALAKALLAGQKEYRSRFLVPTADGFIKLDVTNVAWFYSSQKVTTARTFKSENHVVDFTLDKLDSELDPKLFFRVNRQFILHIDCLLKIENWFNGKLIVKTKPDTEEKVVVSRERARAFKEWVNQ